MRIDPQSPDRKPVVVLGAGPAGLGAAYWLAKHGRKVIVLEQQPRVGGMGASFKVKDYIVDYGPHTFHLKDTPVTELFEQLAGPDLNKVRRNAVIWLHGRTLPFPLRIRDVLTRLNPLLSARMMIDFLYANTFSRLARRPAAAGSFEDWGVRHFGRTLYQLAFGTYTEKVWGRPGRELSEKLAKQKLVGISFWKLLLATLGLLDKRYAARTGLSREALYDAYPRYGIGTFYEALADEIRSNGGDIVLPAQLRRVEVVGNRVVRVAYDVGGVSAQTECEALVSSIPLGSLCDLLPPGPFDDARAAARKLKYRSLIVINFVLDSDQFTPAHWIYLLDPRLVGNRLSEQKHLSKEACPPGRTMLTLDVTCTLGDYLWNAREEFLVGLGMSDLRLMGLQPGTILDAFVLRAANVYPVYTLGFEAGLETILGRFAACDNLFSIGRHGLLLNNDMHDSIEMGFLSARAVLRGEPASAWYQTAGTYVRDRLEGVVRDPIKFDR